MNLSDVPAEAFWQRVEKSNDPDSCWLWLGVRGQSGHGRMSINGEMRYAHRIAFLLCHGSLPPAVCHTCDNPPCCNPKHLWAGTIALNNKDRAAKGRSASRVGEENTSVRISEKDVTAIRADYATGKTTQTEIAERYGLSFQHVSDIVGGKNWSHLPVLYTPKQRRHMTSKEAEEARELFKQGKSRGELMKRFGVCRMTLGKAIGTKRRLTPDEVRQIREALARGVKRTEIEKRWDIKHSMVSNIALGKAHRQG